MISVILYFVSCQSSHDQAKGHFDGILLNPKDKRKRYDFCMSINRDDIHGNTVYFNTDYKKIMQV